MGHEMYSLHQVTMKLLRLRLSISSQNVDDDDFSVGKLLRSGYVCSLDYKQGMWMTGPDGKRVSCFLLGNSLRRKGRIHPTKSDAVRAVRIAKNQHLYAANEVNQDDITEVVPDLNGNLAVRSEAPGFDQNENLPNKVVSAPVDQIANSEGVGPAAVVGSGVPSLDSTSPTEK
jgi:hypothetical protein